MQKVFSTSFFNRISLGAALLALALTPAARAASLAADYQLQDTYTTSVGTAGNLVPLPVVTDQTFVSSTVMGQPQQVLQFTQPNAGTNHGVQVQTNPFVDSSAFSIVLLASFSLNAVNPAADKILDFKNQSADAGLYVNTATGLLSFNGVTPTPPIGGTPVVTGNYTQIVLTRDAAGVVSVYQDGTLAFSFNDSMSLLAVLGDATASGNSFLSLFADDTANVTGGLTNEATNGNIARLRLYNGALTAAEVQALDTIAPIPEPSTYALLALGLGLAGTVARRKTRRAATVA